MGLIRSNRVLLLHIQRWCFSLVFLLYFITIFNDDIAGKFVAAADSSFRRTEKSGELVESRMLDEEIGLVGEGPGSYPPRCTSKCGDCTPCRPVHVPVPPGTPVTTEYYPEAWRCKCRNRLYMP